MDIQPPRVCVCAERMATGRYARRLVTRTPKILSSQAPLVFFHGISPGIFYYMPFLARMGKGREVVLFEVPHIVTQLFFDAPDAQVSVIQQCLCFSQSCPSIGRVVRVRLGCAGWLAGRRSVDLSSFPFSPVAHPP